MGDLNQLDFLNKNLGLFKGPYLEVGSKDYGSTQNLRSFFQGKDYVGVDISAGDGVDVVLDLTSPFDEIEAALGGRRFGTIFCLSVLEHCEQPFVMADNLARLLCEGGRLYVSVPFVARFHGYPSDYWRFTHEGVKKLFPTLSFNESPASVSTCFPGEIRPLNDSLGQVSVKPSLRSRSSLLRAIGRSRLMKCMLAYFYMMPPTMVNMIGTRVGQQSNTRALDHLD